MKACGSSARPASPGGSTQLLTDMLFFGFQINDLGANRRVGAAEAG